MMFVAAKQARKCLLHPLTRSYQVQSVLYSTLATGTYRYSRSVRGGRNAWACVEMYQNHTGMRARRAHFELSSRNLKLEAMSEKKIPS